MLTRMLARAAESDPGKIAIVQGSRRIRYDELSALAGRCATGLQRLGVGAGDCVAVALPNCPEFVATLFGCARFRAIMLPLNPHYTREELQRFLTDASAKVVITDRAPLFTGTAATVVDFDALLSGATLVKPADEFAGRALYLYTSGSTDLYKRLCCTQANLLSEARNFVETVGLTAQDNILCTIPLYHSYGIGNCLLDAVYAASTLVLLEQDDAPFAGHATRVPQLVNDEAIRFYPGVPYQFAILSSLPEAAGENLARLKLCVSSGDVLPRQTYTRFFERFGLPIRSLYGSTEAGSISIDTGETIQFGSVGQPLKNVEIRILDDTGRPVRDHESGQIWVKSPAIPPSGYDNRPELTAHAFRDGYYNTGDIGKIDACGSLVMTGRKQTFVDVGGNKVDIGEVEEVLQSHPRIREAAAVGIEIPNLGTLIKAVVVADDPCREAEILYYCRERLAPFKIPRLVEFRDSLPHSATGKVLRKQLSDATAFLSSVRAEDFERQWKAAAKQGKAQQMELLATHIQEQAGASLQCEASSLVRSAPFQSMGFDSLRVAELQQRLVKLTGLSLPLTLLWNYPSIEELAAALWEQMCPVGEFDSLNRDELAALLAQEIRALEEGRNS
jgi:long-chain acyl-CoA synthetase